MPAPTGRSSAHASSIGFNRCVPVNLNRFNSLEWAGRFPRSPLTLLWVSYGRTGRTVTVRGPFAVFTEGESAELSVLGRDVTNNFSVIYYYPNRAVALLSRPHYYEIKKAS